MKQKQILIRLDNKLLKKIDKARGDIPRVKFIANILEKEV